MFDQIEQTLHFIIIYFIIGQFKSSYESFDFWIEWIQETIFFPSLKTWLKQQSSKLKQSVHPILSYLCIYLISSIINIVFNLYFAFKSIM